MFASPRGQELEDVHRALVRRHEEPGGVRGEEELVGRVSQLWHLGNLGGSREVRRTAAWRFLSPAASAPSPAASATGGLSRGNSALTLLMATCSPLS